VRFLEIRFGLERISASALLAKEILRTGTAQLTLCGTALPKIGAPHRNFTTPHIIALARRMI
jgi:hypothetical protein